MPQHGNARSKGQFSAVAGPATRTLSGSTAKLHCHPSTSPQIGFDLSLELPWLRHAFADGGYAGPRLKGALQKIGKFVMEIIKRTDGAKGFQVLPRRWVVERTFDWLGRCRRLAKDWEKSIASAEAWAFIAHIRLLTRRLASP